MYNVHPCVASHPAWRAKMQVLGLSINLDLHHIDALIQIYKRLIDKAFLDLVLSQIQRLSSLRRVMAS